MSDNQEQSELDFFPEEILLNIVRFLPPEEISKFLLVCQSFNQIGKDEVLWKDKFQLHFSDAFEEIVKQQRKVTDWYARFIEEYVADEAPSKFKAILLSLMEGYTDRLKDITFDQLDLKNKNGESILSAAKKINQQFLFDDLYKIVKAHFMKENGVSVVQDDRGKTLLHFAIMLNQSDQLISSILQQHPEWLNHADDLGQTPLMLAAREGRVSIVDLLLEQEKIDSSACSKDRWTALYYAVDGGDEATVMALLKNKAHSDSFHVLPVDLQAFLLGIAAEAGHLPLVKKFIKDNPNLLNVSSLQGMTPLMLAALNGHAAMVIFLLKQNGIQLSIKLGGRMALDWAVYNGELLIVDAILDSQFKQSLFEKYPEQFKAGVESHPDKIKLLYEAIPQEMRKRLLLTAAKEGYLELVKRLMMTTDATLRVALLNCKNGEEKTPFLLAIDNQHSEMLIFLIEQGAMDKIDQSTREKILLNIAELGGEEAIKKVILKQMLTDILASQVSESLIESINYSTLTKKTSFAIRLLQFVLTEKKREVPIPYSSDLFGNKKRAVADLRIEKTIRSAALLINLIADDQYLKGSELADFERALEDNNELHYIYEELCKIDPKFRFVSSELKLK